MVSNFAHKSIYITRVVSIHVFVHILVVYLYKIGIPKKIVEFRLIGSNIPWTKVTRLSGVDFIHIIKL